MGWRGGGGWGAFTRFRNKGNLDMGGYSSVKIFTYLVLRYR